jgi:hypothetical protein
MNSSLSSIVERSGGDKSSMEDLLLYHKYLGYSSFSLLSRLYPRLFVKGKNFFV